MLLGASRLAAVRGSVAIAACTSSPTTAAGIAASVIPWSGQDQVATVGTTVAMPIQVRVTDPAGNSVTGATVTLSATAADPATLAIVAGDDQSASAGALLRNYLTVEVLDKYGNPVPNASVLWTPDAGQVSNRTTTTDATGVTEVLFTLPASPGTDTVVAVAGTAPPADFTEIAN